MKISKKRLDSLMAKYHFRRVQTDPMRLVYARSDKSASVFQKANVGFQGSNLEVVYGYVSTSVVVRTALKIDPIFLLKSLNTDSERNWSEITTLQEAKQWEIQFAEVANIEAEAFCRVQSSHILQITRNARLRAFKCLNLIGHFNAIDERIREFEENSDAETKQQCERLAHFPGVMRVYKIEKEYILACWAILIEEGLNNLTGLNPLVNNELKWTIQIIADRLLSRHDAHGSLSNSWNLGDFEPG